MIGKNLSRSEWWAYQRELADAHAQLAAQAQQTETLKRALESQCPFHSTTSKTDERGNLHHFAIEPGGYKHWVPCALTIESSIALASLNPETPTGGQEAKAG